MENITELNISSIYRVFNFWIKRGLIHKTRYLYKYIIWEKHRESNTNVMNICAKCENILETCNKKINIHINEFSSKLRLTFSKSFHLEISVICKKYNC